MASELTEEQIDGMIAARNLAEGEPMYVVQSAYYDIEQWLIENRPVVGTKMIPDPDDPTKEIEVKIQEPWDWEAESITIVLKGHPVFIEGLQVVPDKETRDNYIDESMVLGPRGAAVLLDPDESGVQVTF